MMNHNMMIFRYVVAVVLLFNVMNVDAFTITRSSSLSIDTTRYNTKISTKSKPITTRLRTTTSTTIKASSITDWFSSLTSPTNTGRGGVVITGGANGVGYAYACEFISRGYDVVICDIKDCTIAAKSIEKKYYPNANTGKIYHTKCDVSNSDDVIKLGQFASSKLNNYIQYWINNAGINGGRRELRDVTFQTVEAVVKVNLLGILYCTKVAMDIMSYQQPNKIGHIFNTVGSGVKGGGTPGYACYGATKRGLPQLTDSLGTYYGCYCGLFLLILKDIYKVIQLSQTTPSFLLMLLSMN